MGTSLVESVEGVFEEGGAISKVLPEYEPRPGQRQMASAVARAIETGSVLLAEAGTGTGKTLAYLIPGILSGSRVLVSTGTKTLQEQIFNKDLPTLREALGLPFRATCLKGRGNYLCLQRFEAFRDNPLSMAFVEPDVWESLSSWAAATGTGDRAELEGMPEDLGLWSEISASSENCLGPRCPRHDDCFVTRIRQQASDSDLVVVNHHLLCADAAMRHGEVGAVIPECEVAIVDEAHQLEDVATQFFGRTVSNHRVEDLVKDAERLLTLHALGDIEHDFRKSAARVRDRGARFFGALDCLRPARAGGASEDRMRVAPDTLEPAHDPGVALCDAFDSLQAAVVLGRELPEDVQTIGRRAGEMRDELSFLLEAGDLDFVYYLERRGRGLYLRASPVDVSALVREMLLEPMQACVLTSATLAVGGSFEYTRRRLGVRHAEEIRTPSEFNYREQALLYLPARMPDPRSPQFPAAATREIREILRRSEGRAFVLFTSYAMLREVERDLARALDYPVIVQGSAPRSALLREFRSLGNAVLLATSSFWQGVDVVGEALSCVIIDKLPFSSPADPVTAARIEAVNASGDSGFTSYQLPQAVLTLLQGLGRLIRHRQDRGVLAVLDPRIRTKSYGQTFLHAMPPAPTTSDLEDIARFFNR